MRIMERREPVRRGRSGVAVGCWPQEVGRRRRRSSSHLRVGSQKFRMVISNQRLGSSGNDLRLPKGPKATTPQAPYSLVRTRIKTGTTADLDNAQIAVVMDMKD